MSSPRGMPSKPLTERELGALIDAVVAFDGLYQDELSGQYDRIDSEDGADKRRTQAALTRVLDKFGLRH